MVSENFKKIFLTFLGLQTNVVKVSSVNSELLFQWDTLVFMYNKNVNAVDCNNQLHTQYEIGHFSKKACKYLMWFFVNTSIVNAFILWKETSIHKNNIKMEVHPH